MNSNLVLLYDIICYFLTYVFFDLLVTFKVFSGVIVPIIKATFDLLIVCILRKFFCYRVPGFSFIILIKIVVLNLTEHT